MMSSSFYPRDVEALLESIVSELSNLGVVGLESKLQDAVREIYRLESDLDALYNKVEQ